MKSREEFLSIASHELKTPLTAIKGFLEALLEEGLDDRQQAHRFIEIAARQTDRMQAIIQDLLTLSRLEQTGGTISQTTEQLATLVGDALEICLPLIRRKNTTLVVQDVALTAGQDPGDLARLVCQDQTIYCNRNLLEQALVNLIDNAVKYSPEASTVTIGFANHDHQLVLTVKDNGPGIPARDIDRLFERFYRVDRGRSRADGGTGLGLAIVKHIAASHGGTISVESVFGQGSIFRLILPTAPETIAKP